MGQTTASAKQTDTGNLNQLTDHVMAFDLLNAAKAGVSMYARALSESTTPDVRITLNKQLDQAVSFAGQIMSYIVDRSWVTPDDLKVQLAADAKKAQETLDMLK